MRFRKGKLVVFKILAAVLKYLESMMLPLAGALFAQSGAGSNLIPFSRAARGRSCLDILSFEPYHHSMTDIVFPIRFIISDLTRVYEVI